MSSAVKYIVDGVADFGVWNREDLGLEPGSTRAKDVALEPVGCSTILLRREGILGVA